MGSPGLGELQGQHLPHPHTGLHPPLGRPPDSPARQSQVSGLVNLPLGMWPGLWVLLAPPRPPGPRRCLLRPGRVCSPRSSRPCCPHSPRALPGEERFISHLRGCLLGLCPDDPAVHTHSAWTLWSPQHLRASWRQLWQINLHSTTQGTDSMWASGVPLFSALCARQCEAGRHQEGRV